MVLPHLLFTGVMGVREVLSNMTGEREDDSITEVITRERDELGNIDPSWAYAEDFKAVLGKPLLLTWIPYSIKL